MNRLLKIMGALLVAFLLQGCTGIGYGLTAKALGANTEQTLQAMGMGAQIDIVQSSRFGYGYGYGRYSNPYLGGGGYYGGMGYDPYIANRNANRDLYLMQQARRNGAVVGQEGPQSPMDCKKTFDEKVLVIRDFHTSTKDRATADKMYGDAKEAYAKCISAQ